MSCLLSRAAGNAVLVPAPSEAGAVFASVEYLPDKPSVVVSRASQQPATILAADTLGSVHFRATFNKPVSDLQPSKVTLTATGSGLSEGGAGAGLHISVARLTGTRSDRVFALTVSGVTGGGEITVAVAANVVVDQANNGESAARQLLALLQFFHFFGM
jgi:hypothetical protein